MRTEVDTSLLSRATAWDSWGAVMNNVKVALELFGLDEKVVGAVVNLCFAAFKDNKCPVKIYFYDQYLESLKV